jgi:ABC-2 type transport system ATP-binding protein
MIIVHGRIVYVVSLAQIRNKYGKQRTLVVEFEEDVPDFSPPNAVMKKSEGRKKWFAFNRFETSPSTLIAAISSRYPILDLAVEEPEIEEIVRTIYQGKPEMVATEAK